MGDADVIVLRPVDQEVSVNAARTLIAEGVRRILLQAPCGFGKCLGRGTPVVMFDGSVKAVEDVMVGDLLMGPDSAPRRVVSLARGREPLYRVIPRIGEAYVVNESHVLSLKMGRANWRFNLPDGSTAKAGDVVNIEVRDYLRTTKTFRSYAKGWRVAVDFPRRPAPSIPAYVMGAWLGDGTSRCPSITTADTPIADEFVRFGRSLGLKPRVEQNSDWSVVVHMTTGKKGGNVRINPFLDLLRGYGVWMDKHIPDDYLLGSERVRLETLAGLLDTDGSLARKVFTLTQKSERIARQAAFLARSLGFAVSLSPVKKVCGNNGKEGCYWSLVISGDVSRIPCRLARKRSGERTINKNHLLTGITVEPIGDGDYYGFELDGPDRLFLLGDFTVTHNTVVGAYVARSAAEKMRRVLFLVHREELFVQASRTFQAFDVKHSGIAAGLTFDRSVRVQIGMIDTVRSRLKREVDLGHYDIVIVDECHHAVSATWKLVIDHFADRGAVILGLSATPERLSGEPLGDIFDSMIPGPSVRDLIGRGALSEYKYFAPPTDLDLSGVHTKYGDYVASELAAATDKPQIIGDVIRHYRTLLGGKRAIVFAVNVQHSQHIVEQFNAAGIPAAHIDGTMDRAERRRVVKAFERGDILILSNVMICTEGFDVKACDGVILLRATQSLSLHVQMVGRAMRPHESKAHAIIIDHVGNVNRHGLPDADHEWTLEGKKRRGKRKKDDEEAVAVTQCPKCYTCHEPAPVCPGCGHVYTSKARQIAHVDGDLQEITPEMREAMSRQRRQEQGRAQTVEELIALGHNPKAAEKIVQARAAKQELISALIADMTAWSESANQYPLPTFGVSFRDIRYMKPKALKDLRARFEAHKAAYLAGDENARIIQSELL